MLVTLFGSYIFYFSCATSIFKNCLYFRNSLVISEVTVTMETVKYGMSTGKKCITEQTVKEPEVSPKCSLPSHEAKGSISEDEDRPHEDMQQSRSTEYINPEMSNEQGSREEHRCEDEITLFNEYSELPMNEDLPESYIIESMLSDNGENSPDIDQMGDLENGGSRNDTRSGDEDGCVGRRNETRSGDEDGCDRNYETTTVLEPYTQAVEPVCGEYSTFICFFL